MAPRRLFLLLCLLCAGCSTPEQRANISRQDPDFGVWNERVLDKDDYKADSELQDLQARIDSGELPKIQFAFDSSEITDASQKTISAIADWALQHPRLKIRIRAHTCDTGGEDYNQKLSERRARAVSKALAGLGVPPPSMRAVGVGLREPLVENVSEANRERNRRVEFRLEKRDWESIY
jgi:outer membrane protein OmpA-like peptidoglycan-associated protein